MRENRFYPNLDLKDAKSEFGEMSKIWKIPEFWQKWPKTTSVPCGMEIALTDFDRRANAGPKTPNTT